MYPNGNLSKSSYDLIGKVYKSIKEKYLSNVKVISEIGLLIPEGFNNEKIIGSYESLDLNEEIDFFGNKRLGK